MKKIAVIGSGFFGNSVSILLSKKYKVDLFEIQKKIFQGASRYNQMRYHLGFHYPRSQKTFNELKLHKREFESFFNKKIFGTTDNYYGIAKINSKTSFKTYLSFLKKNKLKYKCIESLDFSEKVEGSIICDEKILNYYICEKIFKKKLQSKNIKIFTNQTLKKKNLNKYDKVIICAYDQNNNVLKSIGIKPQKKYRYELIEKILIKLPKIYKNKSFIVLDGKFVCVDPLLNTNYHLLSDNKNSKIEICRGYYPNFKSFKKKYLKKGYIKKLSHSKFDSFIENGQKYLPFLKKAKFVSTSFVTRAIEINKEKTDERVNNIEIINKKFISIFSGKWNTSVGVAKKIYKILESDK